MKSVHPNGFLNLKLVAVGQPSKQRGLLCLASLPDLAGLQ